MNELNTIRGHELCKLEENTADELPESDADDDELLECGNKWL